MSLRELRNLRSGILAGMRALETGGSMRAPTPAGQAPSAGTGKEMAGRIRRQGNVLSSTIEDIIEQQTRPFGPEIYSSYRIAQEATKVGEKQKWLEDFFSGADVYNAKELTYNGNAILKKLENIRGSEEKLAERIGHDTLKNIEKFSRMLAKLQDTRGEAPSSMFHHLMRMGIRSFQVGAPITGAITGYPEIGLIAGLTPEAMGVIMNSPRLSNLLVMGYASKRLPHAWSALGRVAGALHAAGVQLPPSESEASWMPGQPAMPPGGETGSGAGGNALMTGYQQALASQTTERARQYWDEYLSHQSDETAKRAYQQAFQKRFGAPLVASP